uniref:Uncharacterized protein n=1 Tax=Vespula pensylvanica TaxID=30213 RepID=A0A834U8M5_VESPE|nr:hypothetical protein H0235_009623 [Vespula pensylvanica]
MAVSGSGGWLRLADQTTPTRRAGTTTVPREPLPDVIPSSRLSLLFFTIAAIAIDNTAIAVIAAANVNNVVDADAAGQNEEEAIAAIASL